MYKLAVFDVDGTLVSRGKRVLLPTTVEALKQLQEKGVKIAIASGRPPFAMEPSVLNEVDFDFFVCSNGTFIMNAQHEELYREEMPKEIVEALTNDITDKDDAILYQFEDNAYIYHGQKRIVSMIDHCLGRSDILVDDREHTERHTSSLPYAAVAYISNKNIEAYRSAYPEYRFEPFMRNYYDIYLKKCTKATGIEQICKAMNISMDDVICFGDALNDVEMLKQCGCGVAMGDALEKAKAVADYVTTSSDQDGIYLACTKLNLI